MPWRSLSGRIAQAPRWIYDVKVSLLPLVFLVTEPAELLVAASLFLGVNAPLGGLCFFRDHSPNEVSCLDGEEVGVTYSALPCLALERKKRAGAPGDAGAATVELGGGLAESCCMSRSSV